MRFLKNFFLKMSQKFRRSHTFNITSGFDKLYFELLVLIVVFTSWHDDIELLMHNYNP